MFLKCATRCQGKVRHYCAAEAAMEDHPAVRNTQRQVLLWLLTHTRFLPRIYSETRKCFHHKLLAAALAPWWKPHFLPLTSRWCCTSWLHRGWRQRANRKAGCRVWATLASAFSYKTHSHNYLMKRSQTYVGYKKRFAADTWVAALNAFSSSFYFF